MVESGAQPVCRRMTNAAVLRKISRRMIRIGRPVEVRLVTGNAGGRKARVRVVLMALRTHNRAMRARQREFRCVMGECCPLPVRHRVTDAAVLRKTCRRMVWIGRPAEVRLVAGNACGR